MRVGLGYDSHRLTPGRNFILGGISLDTDFGPEAHSDGDVLVHALIDALFGAAALGDIGTHYPPSDKQYKDISSLELLKDCAHKVREQGFEVGNIDATVVLENPKIRPFIPQIRDSLALVLKIPADKISVKGKTAEKMGPVGEGKGVEAYAIVLLEEEAANPEAWL